MCSYPRHLEYTRPSEDMAPASNIVYDTGDPALDEMRTRQMAEDDLLAQALQVSLQAKQTVSTMSALNRKSNLQRTRGL